MTTTYYTRTFTFPEGMPTEDDLHQSLRVLRHLARRQGLHPTSGSSTAPVIQLDHPSADPPRPWTLTLSIEVQIPTAPDSPEFFTRPQSDSNSKQEKEL